jgi:signal recognition particle GTPase
MYEAMIKAMQEEERSDPELLAKSAARRRWAERGVVGREGTFS